ncbi:MAG: prepilin-type N-terminal cleavage/methylation domain-containing protein, partial [Planctomycetaceae bacterium]|nr:prepilin-type N-terminal cleavage/methylation domain-containing protein [Planctomycetaceae bacterium]
MTKTSLNLTSTSNLFDARNSGTPDKNRNYCNDNSRMIFVKSFFGFTLVELLVVIAIIGILIAL